CACCIALVGEACLVLLQAGAHRAFGAFDAGAELLDVCRASGADLLACLCACWRGRSRGCILRARRGGEEGQKQSNTENTMVHLKGLCCCSLACSAGARCRAQWSDETCEDAQPVGRGCGKTKEGRRVATPLSNCRQRVNA